MPINETAEKIEPKSKFVLGDEIFEFPEDEVMPTECLVQLETQKPNDDSKVRPIFAVHAIEGFVFALKPLAAKLNVPVYGLQCTADAPLASLTDLAAFHIKQIKSVQNESPYLIVGYSYGAVVAFEMVLLLENDGERATLVLIDGSPKFTAWYTETYNLRYHQLNDNANSLNQAYSLAYFGWCVAELDYIKIAKELDAIALPDLKINRITKLIAQKRKFPVDQIQLAAVTFYKRANAAHNYKPQRKLEASDVILFKASINNLKSSPDYGLSEVKTFLIVIKNI